MTNISSIASGLTKKEIKQAKIILRKCGAITRENTNKFYLEGTFPIPEQYEIQKSKFISALSAAGISSEILKRMKASKTLGELFLAIANFQTDFAKKEIFPILKQFKPRKAHPLHLEQEFYKKQNLQNECVRYLHALFSTTSKKPEVVAIEKTLREQYGVKLALLNNDLIEAQKILKAVQTAKEKGGNIPNEIIVTNYTYGSAQHLYRSDGTSTILYPSTQARILGKSSKIRANLSASIQQTIAKWREFCQFKGFGSTNSPIHTEMHEIMHQTHTPLYAFKTKKIPNKFMPTVRKLSAYSASKSEAAHEVYTELATKKVLEGLEPDEAELFKFLGGDI